MGDNSENTYAGFFLSFEFKTPNFNTKHIIDIMIIVYPLLNFLGYFFKLNNIIFWWITSYLMCLIEWKMW